MEIVEKYFPSLTPSQKEKYIRLENLYNGWNQKINVVSRKDIDQLGIRHILHSLAIAKYVQFSPHTRILDVGTGGGFPGIPLAIYFPECEFMLVDSIGKKIKVVQSVCEALELKNCRSMCIRAEQLKGSFDFIACRAVAPIPELISWTGKLVRSKLSNEVPNGILALKGGDLKNELNISQITKTIDISRYFSEPFFETKKLIHVIL